jgi:hypothetical protein
LQKQPSGTFEKFFIFLPGQLAEEFPSQGSEFLVEQLDDMKVVEYQSGLGQMFRHCRDIGGRHIGGNSPDLCFCSFDPLPERLEGVSPFAVADENNIAALKIVDNRKILRIALFTEIDFVNSYLLKFMNLWLVEFFLEMLFLDIFDKIPSEFEIDGNISDSHMMAQGQNKPFQRPGTSTVLSDKRYFYLPDNSTTETPDPLY